MLDPRGLYAFTADQPAPDELSEPVLLFCLNGFIDAGQAGRLAADHLLATLDHRLLVSFDLDQLYDYRARRPVMTFDGDHWESYQAPSLNIYLAQDMAGTGFLLMVGPEPDVQWERFVAAVTGLVEHYGVRLSLGVHAIPMGVPHTRPVGVTAHATRPETVSDYRQWVGRVQVPGQMTGLLELRLGEAGRDAAGFAVHVPHYLAQNEYPAAAQVLLESVGRLAGLRLPTQALATAGEKVQQMIAEQLADQPDVAAVVRALEEQYDTIAAEQAESVGGGVPADLPTADELGAELERFLAAENERRGRGEG
ncbi:MAG: PAC2 family protein [Kineosporiaceae bacterium]|nr:PAC2 family protein [Kineosporiaceae bacterium]